MNSTYKIHLSDDNHNQQLKQTGRQIIMNNSTWAIHVLGNVSVLFSFKCVGTVNRVYMFM